MLTTITIGILTLAGVYLLIRLLEWDRTNKDTPNQDDPLFAESEEPHDDIRTS